MLRRVGRCENGHCKNKFCVNREVTVCHGRPVPARRQVSTAMNATRAAGQRAWPPPWHIHLRRRYHQTDGRTDVLQVYFSIPSTSVVPYIKSNFPSPAAAAGRRPAGVARRNDRRTSCARSRLCKRRRTGRYFEPLYRYFIAFFFFLLFFLRISLLLRAAACVLAASCRFVQRGYFSHSRLVIPSNNRLQRRQIRPINPPEHLEYWQLVTV